MTRVQIVATIGPITCNEESLRALKNAGMGIVRLNGSHASLEWHEAAVKLVRRVLPGIPILLDIPGRKIRTMYLAHEPEFNTGDTIVLTADPGYTGTEKVPVSYAELHTSVQPGHVVLADDGKLRFTILSVQGIDIHMRAETPGKLGSRKGINVPFVKLNTPLVTDRDRALIRFSQDLGVDFIGLSFVESSAHVNSIRDVIKPLSYPRIISKIENQGGLDNMDDVIAASDAIMIDRGDLSVETDLDSIALMQKRIIRTARSYSKPVIVATEMLHTMIENSFPTKAEVSDITNAVLDGCAAVMLSGETAVGKHWLEAVSLMNRVVHKCEQYQESLEKSPAEPSESRVPDVMAHAIELIARKSAITKVIAITRSGFAARTLANRAIRQPIIAVSDDAAAARSFNLFPGVEGVFFDQPFRKDSLEHVPAIVRFLRDTGKVVDEDMILVTAVGYPQSGTRMNLIETHLVKDLAQNFRWPAAAI